MKIKLDVNNVLEIYESIRIVCPKCGKRMTPLGDGLMEPYHYCFECKVSVPFEDSQSSTQTANEEVRT